MVVEASANSEAMWFEVRDTGVGIPPAEIEHVFDRFHRARGAVAPGTGLGLALTRELVELNGGRITARSVVGEGSAFRVGLPYRPVTVDVVDARGKATVEVQAGSSRVDALLADVTGRTVQESRVEAPQDAPHLLLVEDNDDLRAFVTGQLSSMYRVSTARDGVEAMDRVASLVPDLVLSDVMMPRMDGFELCRRLRAEPATQALPVILLTARGELEDLVGGLDLGADDYVTKPFHLSELRARIDALLRLRRAERQAVEREARLAAIEAVAEEGEGGVIEAIRSLARLGLVEQPAERELTPLSAWLSQVIAPLHDELWQHGVQVHLQDASGGAALARIDRRELERVLQALVRNAGEAVAAAGSQDGVRHVFLTLEAAADVRIRVADDGPGTPLELARRLFTPRADRSELVQLRDAIRAQGGRLGLEVQAPEGGAAFTIRLPASPPER